MDFFIITTHSFNSRLNLVLTCCPLTIPWSHSSEKTQKKSSSCQWCLLSGVGNWAGAASRPWDAACLPVLSRSAWQLPVAIFPGIQQGLWEIQGPCNLKRGSALVVLLLKEEWIIQQQGQALIPGGEGPRLGNGALGKRSGNSTRPSSSPWIQVYGRLAPRADPLQAELAVLVQVWLMWQHAAEKLTSGSSIDGNFCKKKGPLKLWGFSSALENLWGHFSTGFIRPKFPGFIDQPLMALGFSQTLLRSLLCGLLNNQRGGGSGRGLWGIYFKPRKPR